MPNRRRRKLSTAMSAVAALAVASPFAVSALSELTASKPAPEQHDFVQAAMITDLPGEIMSALQSSLSQFGIVVPNIPSGITGPAASPASTGLPGLGATPGALTTPGLTTPGLTAPGLTAPGAAVPPAAATTPALLDPALTSPALTDPALANPALTNPVANPAAATPALPGLSTPLAGPNPALTSPTGAVPGLTGAPGEVPISAPLGPDPLSGTYPILGGDPGLGMQSAAPSGGLINDLSSTLSQLGGSQAIDLLKGVVVPSIMQAIKGAAPAADAAAPAAVPPVPGLPGMPGLPAAAPLTQASARVPAPATPPAAVPPVIPLH